MSKSCPRMDVAGCLNITAANYSRPDYNDSVQTTSHTLSRRALLSGVAAATAIKAQNREHRVWKPRLGILGPYSEANLAFAREEKFGNMILGSSPRNSLDATALDDAHIENIKRTIDRSGVHA